MKSFLKFSTLTLLLIVLFSFTTVANVSAADKPVLNLESVACFDYYTFQSVQVSAGPEKSSYTAGEQVNFVGEIINQNDYPVVDGNVFVRISKKNPDFVTEGHYAVDENLSIRNVSVGASTALPMNFSWQIPANLGAGDYQADYFFSVDKRFNLGGLPFTNEVVVGSSYFSVENTKNTEFVLDRSATQMNGEKYVHVGGIAFVEKGQAIQITQPVKNLTSKSLTVEIDYNLYYWDSLNEKDKIDTKKETITVPANSSSPLSYTISKIDKPVYYLKIKASSGDVSSIVNVRVSSNVDKARINYPGLTTFPLKQGSELSIFSCVHTVFGDLSGSKIVSTLYDRSGRTITTGEITKDLGTSMAGVAGKFIPEKDYDYVELKTELFDSENNLLDSYRAKYDCATLNSPDCQSSKSNNVNILYLALILLVVSFIILAINRRNQKVSSRRTITIVFSILIILSVGLLVSLYLDSQAVNAETVSADGKTKTETVSKNWTWGWTGGSNGDDHRTVGQGNLSQTYTVTLNGNTTLNVGGAIDFTGDKSCFFYGVGGTWDTPYCGNSLSLSDGAGSNTADITFPNVNPSQNLTSSNSSVLSCSGTSCTAVAAGTAVVTANLSSTVFVPTGCTESNVGPICHNSGAGGRRMRLWNGSSFANTFLTLPGYAPSWTITVSALTVSVIKTGTGSGTVTSGDLQINCGTGAACSKTVSSGANVTLTAAPASGSVFAGWSEPSCTGTALTCVAQNITSNRTVQATFNLINSGTNACGTANETIRTTAPSTAAERCSSGAYGNLTGSGPWSWNCGTASCSAYVASNPLSQYCGTAHNVERTSVPSTPDELCSSGNPSSVSGNNPWSWSCNSGGRVSSCATLTPVNPPVNQPGDCGTAANGQSFSSQPDSNLCSHTSSTPTVSPIGNPVSGWQWTCFGTGTGVNTSCSAPKTVVTNNYQCKIVLDNPSNAEKVNINTLTSWKAVALDGTPLSLTGYTTRWIVTDIDNEVTSYPSGVGAALNYTFTTIGDKKVDFELTSTGTPSSVTTCELPGEVEIVLQGGAVREN